MAEKISMPALEGLILHFMAGGLSQCPDWWGEENISVCYNKLYYIVDGECYIKINQQEDKMLEKDCCTYRVYCTKVIL